jgi:hypothetical protein
MTMTTYRISLYDVADDPGQEGDWRIEWAGLSLWGLRRVLRLAYGRGYSEVSILVEREDLA